MARRLLITDGTITVNLLDSATFNIALNGWEPEDAETNDIVRESVYGEGAERISSQPKNAIDVIKVKLTGTSHDNIATTIQNLMTLKRKAKEYQTTNWQKTPVWIEAQTSGETNTRYCAVKKIKFKQGTFPYGLIFENAKKSLNNTLTIEREPYWRSHAPRSTLPTALTIGAPQAPGTQADATEQFIANYRDTFALTHLYNFDDSLASFSSNLIASSSFSYFPASPALNDIVYFGSTQGPFRQVVVNIGSSGTYNAAMTWEIWTGAAWVSTANYISTDSVLASPSVTTGSHVIVVDSPVGWTTTTINGVSAYWIRIRITSFTSWTSSPTQTGQVVYNPRDAYISVASTQIKGDVDALALLRYFKEVRTSGALYFLAMGVKSRGLTTFTSRLNLGAGNPAAWTITNGADTTTVADTQSPGGSRASCTFAGTTAAAERVRVSTVTDQNIKDMEGTYHAYLRCQQIGGTVGAVSVYLRQTYNLLTDGPAVSPKAVGGGVEILDLGRVEILGSKIVNSFDAANLDFRLSIIASATSTTPDLYLYDLCLIPVDEMALVAAAPDGTLEMLEAAAGLDIDGGLYRPGSALYRGGPAASPSTSVIGDWEHRGKNFMLKPDTALQIHFILASVNTSIYYAREYLGGALRLYAHNRWEFMRGSE